MVASICLPLSLSSHNPSCICSLDIPTYLRASASPVPSAWKALPPLCMPAPCHTSAHSKDVSCPCHLTPKPRHSIISPSLTSLAALISYCPSPQLQWGSPSWAGTWFFAAVFPAPRPVPGIPPLLSKSLSLGEGSLTLHRDPWFLTPSTGMLSLACGSPKAGTMSVFLY